MDRERSEKIAEIFAAASGLDAADRPAFLDRECGGDDTLRSEVLELLGQDDRADQEDFLGARTWQGGSAGPSAEPIGVPGRYVDLRDPKPGGMGVVYRARDVELGRDVAYKVMKTNSVEDGEFRRRFAREAEITSTLQYPGIVPVFGMVTDGSCRPAYATGYIEGANFRELAGRPVVLRERLSSFLAACRIVEHAHKKRFVHGDLSPKNLMIADDGATHVVDWGLARCLDQDSPLFRSNGGPSPDSKEPFTPAYAAPSVRNGGSRTYSTDVYSLGAILASIVLGVRLDGWPEFSRLERRGTPRALRAIIEKAMADREDGLYPDAGAVADDIGRFLDGDKVRADREPPHERAWRSIRRHPARATAVMSTILVLLIARTAASRISENQAQARADLELEKGRARERTIHEEKLQIARTASRRGDWPEALQSYGMAIQDRFRDEIQLRAERLFGFFAVNDEASLTAELADLGRRPDLGRFAAPVDLVRGAYLLCHSGRQEEGRASVRRALEARKDLLSDADVLFAEALTETQAVPMIAALRKAVAADALYYPARANLVVALLASGQPDEAVVQADQLAGLFPDSAVPTLVRSVVALLHGDRGAMLAGLDATCARLKVDSAPLRQYFDTFAEILDIMAANEDVQGTISPMAQIKLARLAPQLEAKAMIARKPLAFAVPSINLLFLWYGEVIAAVRGASPTNDRNMPKLIELGRHTPEALIQSLIVGNHLANGCKLINSNRLREGRVALADLAEISYAAADAPTLLVRSSLRYQTRFVGLFADAGVLRLDPADDRRRILRMRDNLHRLVADGRRWKSSRQQCIPFLLQMMTSSLTPELAADWKRDTTDGAEAFRLRNLSIARMGRTLLEDWLDDEPKNPVGLKWLDDLNRWAERYKSPANPPVGKP